MFVQCTLVKSFSTIYQFMGCRSILLWPKLFPSMANDGFQNSLHWKTRWFSLQRGKRLVALGWFQTLADCKSTTKLVVFRLAINHSSCPCIFIFVFAFVSKIIFQLKYNSVLCPWFVLSPSGVGCFQASAGHAVCFKLTIDGATISHN